MALDNIWQILADNVGTLVTVVDDDGSGVIVGHVLEDGGTSEMARPTRRSASISTSPAKTTVISS